jgi:hypothetical protein
MGNLQQHATGTAGAPWTLPRVPAELQRLASDFHHGWFLGDRERLRDALHPGLARHLCERQPAPRDCGPASAPKVEVLDLYGNLACLRLTGGFGKVLLQASRHGERWRVVNVLGEAARVA